LRDTGLLFAALNPTLTTGGVERIQLGGSLSVTVGYGGNQRHKGGTATIADIARIHNEGLGNVPRRRIIVEPTEAVLKAMTADMNRALKKLADEVSK
jgi:hypothetical protein